MASSSNIYPIRLPPKLRILPFEDDIDVSPLDLNSLDFNMSDALNRTFQELKSKNDEVRFKAAQAIRTAVVVAARGKHSHLQ